MSGGISRFFNQSVSVETLTGSGSVGDVFAAPVTVPCFIAERTKLTKSTQGEEVVSSTGLHAPIGSAPSNPPVAGQFAPGSRVTVNGRVAYVIAVDRQDSAGPARIHHAAVDLT